MSNTGYCIRAHKPPYHLQLSSNSGFWSQPASNYTKHRGLSAHNCWNTIFVPFCGYRWVYRSLFCGALCLKWNEWVVRAYSSHGWKMQNPLFYMFEPSIFAIPVELWFLKTLFFFVFKVKAPIHWSKHFYQKMPFCAANIMGAFPLNNRILNYFPGALALKTWKIKFYARLCYKILTGLGASNWELKKGPKSMTFQKTPYFTYQN